MNDYFPYAALYQVKGEDKKIQPFSIDDIAKYAPLYSVKENYPDYSSRINPRAMYGGVYERSDLVNFILDLNMNVVPFGETGFYGVTINLAVAARNSTTTRGNRTQELLTDSHENVFHVLGKLSDNDIIGFYHIRRLQAAMFPRERDLPRDPYARKGAYWN